MKKKAFESLFLISNDVLEIELKNYYYKVTQEQGKKTIEYAYDKGKEKGWIPCPTFTCEYAGANYKTDGELDTIKVHIFHSIKIKGTDSKHVLIEASSITSIIGVLRKEQVNFDPSYSKVDAKQEKHLDLVLS